MNKIFKSKTKSDKALYQRLADEALYDFKCEEGHNAHELMCELVANVPSRLVRGKKLNPALLDKAIRAKFDEILNSKSFTNSLKSYCTEQCSDLEDMEDNDIR